MVKIARGDIVQVDLSPVVGTEQAGIRPALILQIDRANSASPHTIIAPFTSRIRRSLGSLNSSTSCRNPRPSTNHGDRPCADHESSSSRS
ncbi:MAG: type II toxin-antitoxin system PemK/MazF family toxin [bacterium]|nr:type II toxin-antitoxin system PemK/MazF family toxin [bacterium]